MEPMSLAPREPDNEISLGARLISINALAVVLSDMFRVVHSSEKNAAIRRLRFTKPSSTLTPVLKQCRDLITQANGRSLSRIVIKATISFAKIAQLYAWYHCTHPVETTTNLLPKEEYTGFEKVEDRTKTTRDLLIVALKLCDELRNCPELQEKVREMTRLYEGPRYETVTLEGRTSINQAGHGQRSRRNRYTLWALVQLRPWTSSE